MSQYARQWIVCLSHDLHNTALALSQKKDGARTVGGVVRYKKGMQRFEEVEQPGLARLIVVGHGQENSGKYGSTMVGEGFGLTAQRPG